MDKRAILRVFGEAFLRSMVVLMAIVILGFSVFFVLKVRADKKLLAEMETTEAGSTYSDEELQAMLEAENANDTKEDVTTQEVTTQEETTQEEITSIPSNDKNIVVLNSTSTAGLAGKWKDKLAGAGFSNIGAGNYNAGMETQTKIYVTEEGMGQDLVSYFSGAEIVVGSLDKNVYSITAGSISADTVDIFIVIGNGDTTVQ